MPAKRNYSRDYRIIFENLWGYPRIHVNDLISILGTSIAGKILKKAHEKQIIRYIRRWKNSDYSGAKKEAVQNHL